MSTYYIIAPVHTRKDDDLPLRVLSKKRCAVMEGVQLDLKVQRGIVYRIVSFIVNHAEHLEMVPYPAAVGVVLLIFSPES